MKKINFGVWIVIAIACMIAFGIWWGPKAKEMKLKQQMEMTSREVALLCTTDMATQYHIHPVLSIVINGQEQSIPQDIGIRPQCMTSIHTHSGDGIIHVESPVEKEFVLGDFFAVWKKEFSKDQILDSVVTDTTEIVVMVNGEKVDTYENTILRDKDMIVISYQDKK